MEHVSPAATMTSFGGIYFKHFVGIGVRYTQVFLFGIRGHILSLAAGYLDWKISPNLLFNKDIHSQKPTFLCPKTWTISIGNDIFLHHHSFRGKKTLVFRRFPLTSWVFRALALEILKNPWKNLKGNQWGYNRSLKKAGYFWKGWNIALGGTRPLRFWWKKTLRNPKLPTSEWHPVVASEICGDARWTHSNRRNDVPYPQLRLGGKDFCWATKNKTRIPSGKLT